MRKKLLEIIILGFILLYGFSLTGCNNSREPIANLSNPSDSNSEKEKVLLVQDYFPNKTMTKRFSGGFENGGFTHTIDIVNQDKVQVKQQDTGTGVILVYQISVNDIKLIFKNEVSDGNFKENYLDSFKNNVDEIILKAPIKVGTNWTDTDGGEYEITGVNNQVNTPAGTFETIEVTFRKGDFEIKRYYARNLGLVKSSTKGHREDKLIEINYLDIIKGKY